MPNPLPHLPTPYCVLRVWVRSSLPFQKVHNSITKGKPHLCKLFHTYNKTPLTKVCPTNLMPYNKSPVHKIDPSRKWLSKEYPNAYLIGLSLTITKEILYYLFNSIMIYFYINSKGLLVRSVRLLIQYYIGTLKGVIYLLPISGACQRCRRYLSHKFIP